MTDDYVPRLADGQLGRRIQTMPAVSVIGPRASGKTTTARRYVRSVVRLDRPAEAAAFAADPDAALRTYDEPVLIDEWQVVPSVLGAVKRSVDDDPHPGRYILTGSVRAQLTSTTWPGTGRLVRVPMFGLTEREIRGVLASPDFVDLLTTGDLDALSPPDPAPDLAGYLELALRGGLPDVAVRLTDPEDQAAWLASYLDELLVRDAAEEFDRDPVGLRRYFEALALNSAGSATNTTLASAASLDRRTAEAYDRLLQNLLVVERMPSWLTNRLSRLVKASKLYVIEPSLIGAALRMDLRAVLRDGDLLGRLLDTFVAAQLRPEVELSPKRPRLHHLREKNGRHEVDLLAELEADSVVAIEVKASAAPGRSDARHLAWLRDKLGDRFITGAVLHTGPRAFQLDTQIAAVPIAALWTPR